MDGLLAFAAALVSLRLAAELVGRYRQRGSLDLLVWSAALAAFALASAALAWGAAAGWDDRAFRAYYLFGGLLAAALLGLGSLTRVGVRLAPAAALLWIGLCVGVAIAVPLSAPVTGVEIPDARDHLDLVPARVLAIVGNVGGTAAAAAIAIQGLRHRPVGNGLVLGGIAVAAVGSGLAGLGVAGSAAFALVAAVLLYAGFVAKR